MSLPEKSQSSQKILTRSKTIILFSAIGIVCLCVSGAWLLAIDAKERYAELNSVIHYDRHGAPISVSENIRGHYVHPVTELPPAFITLLIQKEDRFFYYHPGINPFSTARAMISYLVDDNTGGASTITQQLTKIILGTEQARTLKNKFIEALYALSLELFTSKSDVLLMYANVVYVGNQTQGFASASYAYFNKPLHETTPSEQLSLLATLSYPQTRNPWETANRAFTEALHERLIPNEVFIPPNITSGYSFQGNPWFELRTAGVACSQTCRTTIDSTITEDIRGILDRYISNEQDRNVRSGAVVVLDPQTNEVIAMIGTPNPQSSTPGNQINMAITPRPIGSTIKPFIYAKGFADGLRPYTIVDDREYKYPIATGFSLYPKNYDGLYRGEVTLHEALSNSLNVPAVKVLEYIGLPAFYSFLDDTMHFKPIQPYDNYQYGIALGGLEMDLLTLTHYVTLFPRSGTLAPLRLLTNETNNFNLPPQSHITETTTVLPPPYIALVEAILSDRFTGVNQFGLASNLNLTQDNYSVKTGTSRDYHDSWVIGYTPDFVVGVWLGNTENEPLDQVSGSVGAGAIWHDVMEYLFSTAYNKRTPLAKTALELIPINMSSEWGLANDDVAYHQNLLREGNVIISLHQGDVFAMAENLSIPLHAKRTVTWSVNDNYIETSQSTTFKPPTVGTYDITAYEEATGTRERVTIFVTTPD